MYVADCSRTWNRRPQAGKLTCELTVYWGEHSQYVVYSLFEKLVAQDLDCLQEQQLCQLGMKASYPQTFSPDTWHTNFKRQIHTYLKKTKKKNINVLSFHM